ncbi:TerB family tellurite resistance protein [Desulfosarcina sp.]|uniref:tellurite resistance TerB family protein n=1 Tax=Desulfosarcina sp. TaxID=2027861 RepID=UPI003561B95B
MIDLFKRFFSTAADNGRNPADQDDERDVIVAIGALFLEMGRIDETFTEQETATVISILTDKYGLSGEDADALLNEADRELEASVDLWQFARVINERYSIPKKEKLIERLWQIVYVDGKMDKYEHYLMNKLSKLLGLSHKQLIDAKLKVLHGK